MSDIFTVCSLTLQKMFVLFLFIVLGYLFARNGLLEQKATRKALSVLGTYIFFPAYLIKNLKSNFTLASLGEDSVLFLYGIGFVALVLGVGFLLALCLKKAAVPRNTLIYIFAFSNYGYFGYPVMRGVDGFGEVFVAKTIVFALTSTVAIASLGYFLLMGKGRNFLQTLFSPTVLAVAAGMILGLTNFKMPAMVDEAIDAAANCMSPMAMLLTGFVLGNFKLSELFKSPWAYVIAALRLVAMPLIFGIALYACGVRGLLFAIPVILCAMPVGMNTVMFAESAGVDAGENARICFASYLLGIVTIPFAFALTKMLM